MNTRILIGLLLCLVIITAGAQSRPWKNKRCAVVLTYDDALNVHLDKAIPALDRAGMKGTFFLIASAPGCANRLNDWKAAALNGHELANHTLFHPCIGKIPGREWVPADRDLTTYTVRRMEDEVKMTNVFLESLDGKSEHTLAYPCVDMAAGGVSYVDAIKDDLVAARGGAPVILGTSGFDLFNVPSFAIHNETGAQMIDMVKKASAQNGLIIFMFHGVGGEHNINVDEKAHNELVQYLKENEKDIWVTTFIDAMKFTQEMKGNR